LPWLPWNINNPNHQFSKAHLTVLNLNNFKMTEAMRKNYCIKVPLNGITCAPNIMKFYQVVQKLLVADRQTGDLISLLSFFESRLKISSSLLFNTVHCSTVGASPA
jgi:hypothetical protein